MLSKLLIRQEKFEDFQKVENLTFEAFKTMPFSDGKEHELVRNLRQNPDYIPELSLVAELDNEIVGHILFSKIEVVNQNEIFESLALAPLSVSPKLFKKGIGKALVRFGLASAKEFGFQSVIVLGHPTYYPKFGFKPASNYRIKAPFEVPDGLFLAIELSEGALQKVSGTVRYPLEFEI